ncbi:hypothetical protein [Brucella sp. IR073]|uniref:hypothetical protein n=1 Tax=unclassified Brucella TaxID=2632610 RepID=UPI003B982021
MSENLYRALRSVNVPDDLARKAAEELGAFRQQFRDIHRSMLVIRVMLIIAIIGVAILNFDTFVLHP